MNPHAIFKPISLEMFWGPCNGFLWARPGQTFWLKYAHKTAESVFIHSCFPAPCHLDTVWSIRIDLCEIFQGPVYIAHIRLVHWFWLYYHFIPRLLFLGVLSYYWFGVYMCMHLFQKKEGFWRHAHNVFSVLQKSCGCYKTAMLWSVETLWIPGMSSLLLCLSCHSGVEACCYEPLLYLPFSSTFCIQHVVARLNEV